MRMMLSQIKALARAELYNIFGRNVLRFSKDKRIKRRAVLLAVTYIFVVFMLLLYAGALSWGLCMLSLYDIVPAYLIMISGLLIFIFGIFKAGGVMFKKEGYDILSSLPVSQGAIVISRFWRLYVENLLLASGVLLPGLGVYIWFVRPGFAFFPFCLLGIAVSPVLPTVGTVFAGALITAIASRMRYKSLVMSGLSILAVIAAFVGFSGLSGNVGEISPEKLQELSGAVSAILEKVYPPAVWLGTAMVQTDLGKLLLCLLLSAGVLAAAVILIASCFHKICRGLYGTLARHNYRMGELKRNSVLKALVKRELKRYFSSAIYVTNTIIGPVMGVLFSGAVLLTGIDRVTELFSPSIEIAGYIPFAVAGIFSVMNTTCVSVSMEGKHWWIVNSLPLDAKAVLDAKLLMNLILILPFYLVSEVMLAIALRPDPVSQVWLLLIPAVIILFSCVFGLTVNLRLPILAWESETAVVKQSAASMLGGLGGVLLTVLFVTADVMASGGAAHLIKPAGCIVTLLAAAFLYRKNNRVELKNIGE
ncbi:MAG: hypothetical protein NC123_08130 [Butyrivibrio sp.]|nr:hypothetical protein [Acetatifactor muris]MCM1559498.1 hypothetical protein [Butyrivibrio sp.]